MSSTPPTGRRTSAVAARQEALYLSGLLSIAMMSLTMLLATRPAWLEAPLGGMDRVYRTHKWAGILAVSFAAMHWLIEMSDDILKATIGRAGRVPKEKFTGLLEVLRDLSEDMGEWAIYALLVMLVITLWKKFPYRAWRILHRAMPVLYPDAGLPCGLCWHPIAYWAQPVGALMAVLLGVGVYGAIRSLLGGIGRAREAAANRCRRTSVAAMSPACAAASIRAGAGTGRGSLPLSPSTATRARIPSPLPARTRATAPSASRSRRWATTPASSPTRLQPGQTVRVEGPYGRFDIARRNPRAPPDMDCRRHWRHALPRLAGVRCRTTRDQALSADLHYCTRDQTPMPFVPRLEALVCRTARHPAADPWRTPGSDS